VGKGGPSNSALKSKSGEVVPSEDRLDSIVKLSGKLLAWIAKLPSFSWSALDKRSWVKSGAVMGVLRVVIGVDLSDVIGKSESNS
jgi:hypothetical protein